MSDEPILSICIPTRNRRELLKESLASLRIEIDGLPIEVCVSDNASTDGTATMLTEMATDLGWLRVHSHPVDVGIDRNMHHVAGMARGLHIWQLGDDDLVEPGALRHILTELSSEPLDLLILQGRFTTPAGRDLGTYLPRRLAGLRFSDARAAFACLWDRMKYGSFIVAARLLMHDWSRYLTTHHAYAGVIWDCLIADQGAGRPIRIGCGTWSAVRLREAPKSYRNYRRQIMFEDIPRWFHLLPAELDPVRARLLAKWMRSQSSLRSLFGHYRTGQLTHHMVSQTMAEFTSGQRTKARIFLKFLSLYRNEP